MLNAPRTILTSSTGTSFSSIVRRSLCDLYVIVWCFNGVLQGSVSLQRDGTCWSSQYLFWGWKSSGDMSFWVTITFHQPTNAAASKKRPAHHNHVRFTSWTLGPKTWKYVHMDAFRSSYKTLCFYPLRTILTPLWTIIGKQASCKENAFTHLLLPLTISAHQLVYAP